jgi:hypothetical protein
VNKPTSYRGRAIAFGVCLGGALLGLLPMEPSPAAPTNRGKAPTYNQPSQFYYPLAGQTVRCNKEGSFAAYGVLNKEDIDGGGVYGVLKEMESGTVITKGWVLKDALTVDELNWSIGFLRLDDDTTPQKYKIELRSESKLIATLCGLTLKRPGPKDLTKPIYPVSPGPVNPTFTSWGTSDTKVTGGTMVKGCTTVSDQVLQSGNTWFVTIKNVPSGTGWTLNIYDTGHPVGGASAAATVTPLTVN